MHPQEVIVLGGGLAGIASAIALADKGFRVSLLEKRPFLGGRASSFEEPESGETIDNCQHVVMPCCTNLMDFYERLDVADKIQFHSRIPFLHNNGDISWLTGSCLPAPLHTAPSFLRMKQYSMADKTAIAYAMTCMLTTGSRRIPSALDGMPFLTWLRQHHQTDAAIEKFWKVILVSALNEDLHRISTWHAFKVFLNGFLDHHQAYHVGLPSIPLGALYHATRLQRAGQRGNLQIALKTAVRRIHVHGQAISHIELADGTIRKAPWYISALPPKALLRLLSRECRLRHGFHRFGHLETSPITSVHLWYDRRVTDLDVAVLLDRHMQWMFHKTSSAHGQAGGGSYLGLVVSASKDLMHMTRAAILAIAIREMHVLFPETRKAALVKSRVVREPEATFSVTPGIEAMRPAHNSPISNLYLAGDWTATGWPATMESAVRSGYRCADGILASMGMEADCLCPDLPRARIPDILSRLL